eukprot:gene6884-7659_t
MTFLSWLRNVFSSEEHPENLKHHIPPELIANRDYQKIFDHCKKFKAKRKEIPMTDLVPSKPGQRSRWQNQSATQVVEPLYYFKPDTLSIKKGNTDNVDATDYSYELTASYNSIVSILKKALATNDTVKAAGSGHSYSDVASTCDYFIDTHGLNKVADKNSPIEGQLSQDALKSSLPLVDDVISWKDDGKGPEAHRALFETEAGITIKDLNEAMFKRNVAMINMGGYDGQTIVGAISTSTHGSGVTLPPFPDLVQSLVLATTGKWNDQTVGGSDVDDGGVWLYRIEPTDGITDPTKYSHPQIQLIQDDHCFHSVICSMGCIGVIYSIVIEVMQVYWLEETRYKTTLEEVIKLLSSPEGMPGALPTALQETRNLEVLIHPYPMDGSKVIEMDFSKPPETYYKNFKCLVTKRNIVPRPDNPEGKKGHRNFFSQLFARFELSFEIIVELLNLVPDATPFAIDEAMNGLVDESYINKSYDIYNLGLNQDAGVATEIGFPIQTKEETYTKEYFVKAVDKIHRIGQNSRINGNQYQTSPFALRFVKSSNAKLSMMHGANTCMIEMDMITGTYGTQEIMKRYQNAMYKLAGRPHWGLQFDNIPPNVIPAMYSQFKEWVRVYKMFNSKGTFSSPFTDRVGITDFTFN